MKRCFLIIIILLITACKGFADEEIVSYKVQEDEYDIEHSFFFKVFIVNSTGKSLKLSIQQDKDGYGEVKIGNGEFIADPEEINETELSWRKGWAVQREISLPILLVNGEHPDYEDVLAEVKLNSGKQRTVKDAVEMVFHKKKIKYTKQNIQVCFEVSGNSDVLFIIVGKINHGKKDPGFM